MRIKGVTRQWEGGGYYRIRQPLGELARHGHTVTVEPARSGVCIGDAEVFVGHLIGGVGVVNGWGRKLAKDARIVYELDDDPFEIEAINPVYSTYTDPVAVDSITHCIQVADMITASTPVLAERMRKLNPNVVVLQNHIDEAMFSIQRPRHDKVTIGWAGGFSHTDDIKECAYGLRKVLDRNKHVEGHFVGSDFRYLIGRPMRYTEWCSKTTEYYKNIDFDIGIAPLRSTRFAETKSHIKALEYAALGIPCVASDTAPYRDFVVDGVTGFLVRREHEWAARLRDLVNDAGMREEMGAKAKQVAAGWTMEKGWVQWEAAYKSLL